MDSIDTLRRLWKRLFELDVNVSLQSWYDYQAAEELLLVETTETNQRPIDDNIPVLSITRRTSWKKQRRMLVIRTKVMWTTMIPVLDYLHYKQLRIRLNQSTMRYRWLPKFLYTSSQKRFAVIKGNQLKVYHDPRFIMTEIYFWRNLAPSIGQLKIRS